MSGYSWQWVGEVNASPTDTEIVVGNVVAPASGPLIVKCVQLVPTPFQFGYGLLSYESDHGRELGTIRVWPRTQFTSYAMGDGLNAADRSGRLVFEPRTWSLRWVKAGFPLSVAFLALQPTELPADRFLMPALDGPDGILPLSPTGSPVFPT
jgi:hypothetical protein